MKATNSSPNMSHGFAKCQMDLPKCQFLDRNITSVFFFHVLLEVVVLSLENMDKANFEAQNCQTWPKNCPTNHTKLPNNSPKMVQKWPNKRSTISQIAVRIVCVAIVVLHHIHQDFLFSSVNRWPHWVRAQ